ncbi:MAG: GNAT family N-acetyltransferase [Dehalococcoidia bacterium]|nr:GNAT family N-acetyltransferase [Dehalococcoidia bacterium]
MTIELRQARAEDVPELGRICYEAFKDISERHGFPTDFQTVEFAQQVVGMLVQQEDVYSIGAFDGGQPKGSNFLEMWDEVAGIGPISVDVSSQGQGIGKTLMEEALRHGRERGFDRIRLCQDSFNMRSLALYASLGFDTKEPIAYLALSSEASADPAFRPATAADLPAMDELCQEVYRISRRNECERLIQLGFPAFVLDRGHVAGYLIGTAIGHGAAEDDAVMLALLAGVGATVPDAHSFVPLRSGALYREALVAGHRNQKVMNLMAFGPYEEPQGTFCPSVLF